MTPASTHDHDPRGATVTVEAHVYPVDDLIDHDTDSDDGCPCGPTQVPVEREDGSIGWYASHHSLDGRELQETP